MLNSAQTSGIIWYVPVLGHTQFHSPKQASAKGPVTGEYLANIHLLISFTLVLGMVRSRMLVEGTGQVVTEPEVSIRGTASLDLTLDDQPELWNRERPAP